MSDEERKAMKLLNDMIKHKPDTIRLEWRKGIYALQLLLNLIEKQQKEIEELKVYKHDAELTKIACCTAQNCEALNNCIKLARELQNADKKWKDKIKAKIEEINKEMLNEENSLELFYRKKYCKEVLQSLLEKE